MSIQISRSESWRHLVQAYQICTQKYATLLSSFDLTPSQFDVLLQIEMLGRNAKPKSIANGLLVTKGNITSITKRLLERRLILREPDEQDKRSSTFQITEDGKTILRHSKLASKAFIDAQLSPFSDEEVKSVGSLMQKMRFHLESNVFDEELMRIKNNVTSSELIQ